MIVYSVIITAILACVLVSLGYEHILRVKAQDRALELEKALFEANEEIVGYRIEKANRDGVDAGRISDTMYKGFLEQFNRGEQVTVMFHRDDAKYYEPTH